MSGTSRTSPGPLPWPPGLRIARERPHPRGDDEKKQPGRRADHGHDRPPRHPQPDPRSVEQHQRAGGHRDDAADREDPVAHDLDLRDQHHDPEQDQEEPRVVDRQALEGEEREDQRDPADDPGQDRARVGELEEEAEHPEHHQDVGDVRVGDDVEDAVAGAIAATCAASVMKTPAEAARAPVGATKMMTGTSAPNIRWTIARMDRSSPPGVSSWMTSAWARSLCARSSASPTRRSVTGLITPSMSIFATGAGAATARPGPSSAASATSASPALI